MRSLVEQQEGWGVIAECSDCRVLSLLPADGQGASAGVRWEEVLQGGGACQLSGFPACRLVGKLAGRVGGGARQGIGGVRERGERERWLLGMVRGGGRRPGNTGRGGCSGGLAEARGQAEGLVVYPRVRERNRGGGFSRVRSTRG